MFIRMSPIAHPGERRFEVSLTHLERCQIQARLVLLDQRTKIQRSSQPEPVRRPVRERCQGEDQSPR